MSAELAVVQDSVELAIPEARVLTMIAACAATIQEACSVPTIKVAITQAEAILTITKHIEASESLRREALKLRLQAEAQLGRVVSAFPQGKRGKAAVPGQVTKRMVMKEQGIERYRASLAEKLAEEPEEALDQAAADAKNPTLHSAYRALGYKIGTPPRQEREVTGKSLAYHAIGLLVRCQSMGRAPTAEEVEPLREAYGRIGLKV